MTLQSSMSASEALMCSRTTLKKVPVDKLVSGCFFVLAFVASVGCVPKSAGKCREVLESEKKCIKGKCGKVSEYSRNKRG